MKQPSDNFVKGIELLDFQIGHSSAGNVLLISEITDPAISPAEVFALEQASYYQADAVYFRRFEDNRPALSQIFIYDNSHNQIANGEEAAIHRNLWSAGIVALFLIIDKSRVRIYDCRKPVESFMGQISSSPLEVLDFGSDALHKYSARLFDNGAFWESAASTGNFLEEESAFHKLIAGLKKIRNAFLLKSGLPEATAHKLLVQSILIKYLEERGEEGEMLFAKEFFRSFGADNFCGILRMTGKIVPLFQKLSGHFNGKIFEWTDPEEIDLLETKNLSMLADFLDGDNENNQYVLWRLYSFRHLPVELISSVYEEFLGAAKKDVVYTPHYLVNFLVDECMPLHEPQKNFKLIDVSCGSGIFLVSAFKRLVEWWRYQRYTETGMLQKANSAQLLKILKASIHGVDLSEESTKLTIFSLALALCDMLTPKEIWTELQFDDLTENNIHAKDFFDFQNNHNSIQYNLVIGNPPFNPPVKMTNKEYQSFLEESYTKLNFEHPIPDNNVALIFLDQAMKLLTPGGRLCLIVKSAPLLYNNTLEFRKYFFEKYNVLQVADFTSLKKVLFGKANVETAAIFVENRRPDEKHILHLTIRNTKPVEQKLFFEIDHYDFHFIKKYEATTSKTVWKSNLLGGGRLNQLISRLAELPSLREYLKKKKKSNDWEIGEGFIRGKTTDPRAPHLTGKPSVIADNFTADYCRVVKLEDIHFERARTKELFKGPLLLIKENIEDGKIPVKFIRYDVCFDSRIVGISAPMKDLADLQRIKSFFAKHNDTSCFYIFSTTSQFFMGTTTAIQKKDIMNIPFPEHESELQLSYSEKIIRNDVLNYRVEQLFEGENARINTTAGLKMLESFSQVFCRAINSIYEEGLKKYQLHSILSTDAFYACEYHFSKSTLLEIKKKESRIVDKNIEDLVFSITGSNLRITRVLKFYAKDRIYLIKPKQTRYWLKSVALRDADETFDEILEHPEHS